jgi:hypothetical protein
MIGYSKMIREECKKHSIPYFDTSNEFENTVQEVVKALSPTL